MHILFQWTLKPGTKGTIAVEGVDAGGKPVKLSVTELRPAYRGVEAVDAKGEVHRLEVPQ